MTHALNDPDSRPQLLVSVRNLEEARIALAGGCEILDIKAPERGSLGMADVQDIAEILAGTLAERCGSGQEQPASAALGEALDWAHCETPHLPAGLTFLKLGTAGLATAGHGTGPDWKAAWQEVRRRFDGAEISPGTGETAASPQWILVAYADWQRIQGPAPREVLASARDLDCAGVLIDTCVKDGRGLLHWMPPETLRDFVAEAARLGLLSALAGSLSVDDAPLLRSIAPDLVGIRSAACRLNERQSEIEVSAVRRFKARLSEGAVVGAKSAGPVSTRAESQAASGAH